MQFPTGENVFAHNSASAVFTCDLRFVYQEPQELEFWRKYQTLQKRDLSGECKLRDDGQQGSKSGKCFVGPAWSPWNLLTGLSTVQFPFMQLWATIPQGELEEHDAENFQGGDLCLTIPCWNKKVVMSEWNVQNNNLQPKSLCWFRTHIMFWIAKMRQDLFFSYLRLDSLGKCECY